MQVPALWGHYCRALGLSGPLTAAWWAAICYHRGPEARAMRERFLALSKPGLVDTQGFRWAGPGLMAELVEDCIQRRLLSRAKGQQIIQAILACTVVEVCEDWRGVQIPTQRWFTEAEKEKAHAVHMGWHYRGRYGQPAARDRAGV